jgi:hypothetical protein
MYLLLPQLLRRDRVLERYTLKSGFRVCSLKTHNPHQNNLDPKALMAMFKLNLHPALHTLCCPASYCELSSVKMGRIVAAIALASTKTECQCCRWPGSDAPWRGT